MSCCRDKWQSLQMFELPQGHEPSFKLENRLCNLAAEALSTKTCACLLHEWSSVIMLQPSTTDKLIWCRILDDICGLLQHSCQAQSRFKEQHLDMRWMFVTSFKQGLSQKFAG